MHIFYDIPADKLSNIILSYSRKFNIIKFNLMNSQNETI